MKKLGKFLLVFALLFAIMPTTVHAENGEEEIQLSAGIIASGECGDVKWEITSDKLLGIWADASIPAMPSYDEASKYPWSDYKDEIETISFKLVSGIGDYAFEGFTNLKTVYIPGPMRKIGNSAFEDCSNLTTVNCKEGVTEICDYAFAYCKNLTTLTIPASVKEIGESAFCETSIKSIVLPNGLKKVDDCVFYRCKKLESVTIPASVEKICDSAFGNCPKLTTVNISEGVKKINYDAFGGCGSLKSIVIPASVSKIELAAFLNCKNMKAAYIKGSDTQIDKHAFGFYEVIKDTSGEEFFVVDVKLNNFTLVAKKGSKAEAYAKKNNLKFAEYSSAQKISSISKLKGGLKVKWKKNSTATGYKIRYSLNKNMSGAKTISISKNKTTSKKITKLKKKTKYYVQIRSYKTVNGITFLGDWSAVKSQTTK